jgi:hypothetical protein
LIDSLIVNKQGGCIWEVFLEFCIQKSLKATVSHLRMNKKSVYEHCSWSSRDRVAVVSSLDCCLLVSFTSVFVLSTINGRLGHGQLAIKTFPKWNVYKIIYRSWTVFRPDRTQLIPGNVGHVVFVLCILYSTTCTQSLVFCRQAQLKSSTLRIIVDFVAKQVTMTD